MEGQSKVRELVEGLREEESRIKAEIAQARKSVRQWEKDLAKVRAGLRSLTGGPKSGKKKASSSRSKAAPAAVANASHVINAPREYRCHDSGDEPDGPAAPVSQPIEETAFEGCL